MKKYRMFRAVELRELIFERNPIKMKYLFLIGFVIYVTITVGAQSIKKDFILNGTIDTGDENKVYFMYHQNDEKKAVKDSTIAKNGKFTFKGIIDGPSFAIISLANSNELEHLQFLFIEPKVMNIQLSKSPLAIKSMQNSKTDAAYRSLLKERDKCNQKYQTVIQLRNNNIAMDEGSKKLYSDYQEMLRKTDLNFFEKHPQSIVTAFLLQNYYGRLPMEKLFFFYDNMGKQMQETLFGQQLIAIIKRKENNQVGKPAIAFEAQMPNDSFLKLADYKGKYVLLEFWASWCKPCRAEHAEMIALYNELRGKGIEFIGISSDSDNKSWKLAIEKDMLPWPQVISKFDNDNMGTFNIISRMYAVSLLPTLILIDHEGIIVGRYSNIAEAKKNIYEIAK